MKGQWAHIISRENRSIARQNRILFTSFLIEKGHDDIDWLANFWGVSRNTIQGYIKEAKHVRLDESDREKINEIKSKKNCSLSDAVAIYYNQLLKPPKCFIATAVYGTAFAPEIDVLRHWRDKNLKDKQIGKLFIKVYYAISPPIADFIKDKETIKKSVRIILKPIIAYLKNRC